jgi:hypothetical protein
MINKIAQMTFFDFYIVVSNNGRQEFDILLKWIRQGRTMVNADTGLTCLLPSSLVSQRIVFTPHGYFKAYHPTSKTIGLGALRGDNLVGHPHMSSAICLGNSVQVIEQHGLTSSVDKLSDLWMVYNNLLNTYNPESPYEPLEEITIEYISRVFAGMHPKNVTKSFLEDVARRKRTLPIQGEITSFYSTAIDKLRDSPQMSMTGEFLSVKDILTAPFGSSHSWYFTFKDALSNNTIGLGEFSVNVPLKMATDWTSSVREFSKGTIKVEEGTSFDLDLKANSMCNYLVKKLHEGKSWRDIAYKLTNLVCNSFVKDAEKMDDYILKLPKKMKEGLIEVLDSSLNTTIKDVCENYEDLFGSNLTSIGVYNLACDDAVYIDHYRDSDESVSIRDYESDLKVWKNKTVKVFTDEVIKLQPKE